MWQQKLATSAPKRQSFETLYTSSCFFLAVFGRGGRKGRRYGRGGGIDAGIILWGASEIARGLASGGDNDGGGFGGFGGGGGGGGFGGFGGGGGGFNGGGASGGW